MGAHPFHHHVSGTQPVSDAYTQADREAREEEGNNGYNGTISTTSGYRQVEQLPMTVSGARLYADLNVDRAHKWDAALAVPTSDDDSFTFRTVTFTVALPGGGTDYDIHDAGRAEALKRYSTALHAVDVGADIKSKVVVAHTPGRPVLKYSLGDGYQQRLFDTRGEAVAAAKAALSRPGTYQTKLEVRVVKYYDEGSTTVATTVDRVITKATGRVTVTLATLKVGVQITGWMFFGMAAS